MKAYLLLAVAMLLMINVSNGQDVIAGQLTRPNLNALSPQTSEFVKYGNIPVSHFVGDASLKIPVYTYKDQDFELPIFLGHSASGFNPNKREGIAGLNFYLNAGGAITRQIRGVPDEKVGNTQSVNTYSPNGLLVGIRANATIKNKTLNDIFSFTAGTGAVNTAKFWVIDNTEVESDEFTFNAPGFSGKFFIENNGTVRTLGNKPFKVDLAGMANQPFNASDVTNSGITITTDDGYKYTFGNTKQYLEVSYQIVMDAVASADIVAWHLRKIEAPNGRTVSYVYKNFQDGFQPDNRIPNDTCHYLLTVYNTEFQSATNFCSDFPTLINNERLCSSSGSSGQELVKETTKTVYLEKIIIDKITIQFDYIGKAKKFYGSPEVSGFNQKNLRLTSIKVLADQVATPLHEYTFKMKYLGTGFPRLFLTSFEEKGTMRHSFTYYNETSAFPNPLTNGVDHWGYWNGGTSTTSKLIPSANYAANGDVYLTSNERNTDTTYADFSLLKRVTYPTGGYSEFTYEPHDYGQRLERKNAGQFLPYLYAVTGYAGGARISKIVDHDGTKVARVRQYKYAKNYTSGGTATSGILLNWPRYIYYWKYDDGSTLIHMLRMKSSSFHTNHYPGEGHMQYSEVTELITPSGGYTNYKFTSYVDRPDTANYNTFVVLPTTQTAITNLALYNNFIGIKFNDRSFERGQPLEVTTRGVNSSGVFYDVSKKITKYTTLADNPTMYSVGVQQTGGLAQSFKIYYYPFLPKRETEIQYSDEGLRSVSSITDYTYNTFSYLATKTSTASDGKVFKTKYRYVRDFITDADDPVLFTGTPPVPTTKYTTLPAELKGLVDMKRNNIINRPVEVIDYVNNNVISSGLLYYKDFGITTAVSKKIFTNKHWMLNTTSAITNFVEASINRGTTWSFTRDTRYSADPEITFDKYDTLGNIREMTDKDMRKLSFRWGYSNLYPVAEIVGAPYDKVFYTGFEDETTGFVDTDCKTGRKAKNGTYSVALTGLTAGTYVLSYWRKQTSGSNWELFPTDVTVSGTTYTISIPTMYRIDDVRFYPKQLTQMSTFTYDLGVGMTSKTDSNNKTSYFTYDGIGRLNIIQDHLRSIQKIIDYNYKQR